jgi:PAS domain S-box-containing protein
VSAEDSSTELVLFEQLAAVTDAMVFVTDATGNDALWTNEALVEITGYTLEDFQFQRFENPFIPAEDAIRVGEFLVAFLGSDETVSTGQVRNRFVDRWGGTLHVRSRLAKVVWQGKDALLYWTVLERREEDPMLDAEQRYRSLVEVAADSIVRLRCDLTVHYSNQCFQDLVGKPPVELNVLEFPMLVAESHRDAVRTQLSGDAPRIQLSAPVHAAREGETAWLEGDFIRIERGPDAGLWQAILRDTTRQRRLDERVQQAQRRESLGEMAGGIAHDLNNILTGILGSATLAEGTVVPGSPIAKALSDIRLAAERAGELSSSMLAFAGEGNAERLAVDVGQLVGEMERLLVPTLGPNVRLSIRTPDAPVAVLGDEIQLRQIVMNLITNAAEATGAEGGEVDVEVCVEPVSSDFEALGHVFGEVPTSGPAAVIRVRDRGCGIEARQISRIFEPFHSTKAKGRGLGLAAVVGILDRHDGCIRVQSEIGRGTSMDVMLPLTETLPRPEARETALPDAGAGGTLLVVDDEPMLRRLAQKAFEGIGFEVLEAGSGEEALELLDSDGSRVSAVVLDRTMPGMGGDQALREIRARRPSLPVLRISGYTADDSPSPDPHTAFLGKPYGIQQLLRAVLELVEHDRA